MSLKDIIYVIAYISSVIGVFLAFRARLASLEREIKRNDRVIYGDQGKLNIIDEATCKAHRDIVFDRLRHSEKAAEMMLSKIDELNKNVLTILVYLNIKSPNGLKFEKRDQNNM